jgi:hypothetical protein
MSKIDMSPTAITMRLERLSQMRELGLLLKQAGQKAGLHNKLNHKELDSPSFKEKDSNQSK